MKFGQEESPVFAPTLRQAGYRFQYTLEEAFEDWKREQYKSSMPGSPELGTPRWARFRRKLSGALLD